MKTSQSVSNQLWSQKINAIGWPVSRRVSSKLLVLDEAVLLEAIQDELNKELR